MNFAPVYVLYTYTLWNLFRVTRACHDILVTTWPIHTMSRRWEACAVLEAKNPWRLRSGAAAMDAAGDSIDQEIYRMDNLVAGAVSGGADAWMGDGASACVQAFQKQVTAFRRTTNALREASSVLKWLADRAEEINALRDKARALRQEADRISASVATLDPQGRLSSWRRNWTGTKQAGSSMGLTTRISGALTEGSRPR